MNQSPQQRFVTDNLDVMFDAGPIRHSIDETGDISNVANRFQLFTPVEFFDQRDHVDGM